MRKKHGKTDLELQVSSQIRDLMARHGIIGRSQTGKLSRVLKVSNVHAYRKLHGQSPWTLEQIGKIASHFGETMSALLDVDKNLGHEAVLILGRKEIPCLVQIGAELSGTDTPSDFVAIRQNDQWKLYETKRAPLAPVRYLVESMEIRRQPADASQISIGVVDDDKDAADSIRELLVERGYRAAAYYTLATAHEVVLKGVHDVYVIDWLLGTVTAESLIRSIRTAANPTPIFLLTGQLNTGRAEEHDIARVIRGYDVEWLEKPVRMPLLEAKLSKKLGTRSRSARGD
ncbi:MAG: helix-turn-helix domain-containing protein [Sulfuricaulis sp.]